MADAVVKNEYPKALPSFVANVVSVMVSAPIGYVFIGLWFGIRGLDAFLFCVYVATIAMCVDECGFKAIFRRVQFNWQDVAGSVLVAVTATDYMEMLLSKDFMVGFVATLLAPVLTFASWAFWYYSYRYSIMKGEETDKFDRKRFGWMLKWGDWKHCFRVLCRFLRYRCVSQLYDKGSDYDLPFDDKKRTVSEMKVDRFFRKLFRKDVTELDKTIELTSSYVEQVAKNIVSSRGNK